ncbi:uncharacterized protein DUF1419 [Rhizobium azibense]|uniref:Uncharacterized protein DUF1419 n=1 Tax=Rhizobium azibense TaxID=1136135 RepID=A0A4V2VDP6_9HYPH|nr:uncharacterized protein DUF1419 [Rhizobium azibense]
MTASTAIRKVFQGVATGQQMFRMFDRHAQRPNRWRMTRRLFYAGERFEIGETYMFEILQPLWIRGSMFAMREFLTSDGDFQVYVGFLMAETDLRLGVCD